MNKIAVGTDGSPSSYYAVEIAAELAAATQSELHMVCVATLARDLAMRSIAPLSLPDDYDDEAEKSAEHVLSGAADKAAAHGVTPVVHVLDGDPASELIAFCKDHGVDILVVGSHGMTGASRFILGNVPDRCAHHAPCSVLVARAT